MKTRPLRVSEEMHHKVKLRAAECGMKLQALAELALEVWLNLPKKKAFPKK